MADPVLNDYEYQFSTVLFNGSTTLPFIDVHKVDGLDMPPIPFDVTDLDSTHGSTVTALYATHRTIVIEGTLYANPNAIDINLVDLHTAFTPTGVVNKFFYKHPGIPQMYIYCVPVGLRYSVDTLRRTGSCAIQFQLVAADPRKYSDNADKILVPGNSYQPPYGSIFTYPVFEVAGEFSTFTLSSGGKRLRFDYGKGISRPTSASSKMYIHMDKQIITKDTIDGQNITSWYLANTTTDRWWKLFPVNNILYENSTAYLPVVKVFTKRAWL